MEYFTGMDILSIQVLLVVEGSNILKKSFILEKSYKLFSRILVEYKA